MQKATESPTEPLKNDKGINNRREQRKAKLEALRSNLTK